MHVERNVLQRLELAEELVEIPDFQVAGCGRVLGLGFLEKARCRRPEDDPAGERGGGLVLQSQVFGASLLP
jgi:hypothetical protein